MNAFVERFEPSRVLPVGGDGISIEDLLGSRVAKWIATPLMGCHTLFPQFPHIRCHTLFLAMPLRVPPARI